MMELAILAEQSTCLKRVTICELYEPMYYGWLLVARASNRCEPPNGQCTRMSRSDGQAAYPSESGCNWSHAEQRAAAAIPDGKKPTRAIVYGHDFPCPDCERQLRAVGITDIEIYRGFDLAPYVGLRPTQWDKQRGWVAPTHRDTL